MVRGEGTGLPRGVRLALRAAVGCALASALVLGLPAAWAAASSSGRFHDVADVPPHDVAVILAAEVYADGTPAPFTAARLDVGLALYRAGKAKVLLVSGNDSEAHHRETASMRRYLVDRGVPDAHVVEDTAGNDTYDTCIRIRDTFGVRSAILVSQTYHLPRAVTTCRALGVDAVGVGDDSVADRGFWPVGVAREFPANVKMVLDLVSGRGPEIASPPSSAVEAALNG